MLEKPGTERWGTNPSVPAGEEGDVSHQADQVGHARGQHHHHGDQAGRGYITE
jgi:hypothetical protein